MAYEKTIWKNREVERPRTFEKVENPDGTITLVPAEGNIIEEGTPIIAENMNKIEQGIKDAHDEIDEHKADNFHHIPYVIATGTNSYAVNIQGITALTEGMSVKVKFTSANTGACTLNINGLGAKEIRKSNGNSLSAGNIKAGQILHLVYTGSVFQLLGEGGEYGTAQPNHVLEGITFGTEDGLKVGTMPNRGAVTNTITTQGGSYTIPAGYHNGSGKVTAQFANLVAGNIKKGVNVGGVVGTYDGEITIKSGTSLSDGLYTSADLYASFSDTTPKTDLCRIIANQSGLHTILIQGQGFTTEGYASSGGIKFEIIKNGAFVTSKVASFPGRAEGGSIVTHVLGAVQCNVGDVIVVKGEPTIFYEYFYSVRIKKCYVGFGIGGLVFPTVSEIT